VESILEKEPETIAWINNFDDISKPTFFDIGANIGVYSLYAGYRHPAFEIFPFEPVSNNFTALKNILINKQTRIYPLQLALSNNKKNYKYLLER
jgi:FkbM family methyltransferase